NVESGVVECLELPLQLSRIPQMKDQLIWYKKALISNEMKNSRGFKVVGDKRSHGSGWGHVSSPIPTVAGAYLYVPVMNGTVYVIEWNADKLKASAVKAINDLGTAGQSWMRSSFSFSNERAYTHTIGELICIGK
ncbi:MAG: hypothetical protein P8M70_08605, partial [Verrucomicrobiota bacterium]|nr:hypothetical protein [Verrucomicrobiota bacterium]